MLNNPICIPLLKVTKRTIDFVNECTKLVEQGESFILTRPDPKFPNQFRIAIETRSPYMLIRVDENLLEEGTISMANLAISLAISTNSPITFQIRGKQLIITTLK